MKSYTHLVNALVPVADALAGTKYTDVVSLKNHDLVEFILQKGAGATGTSTVTVEACDDTTPTTSEAIAFKYQAITSGDTHGALTNATTSGFTTTAGANQMYKIVVHAQDLASLGYEYVRVKFVEVADDPVTAGVLAVFRDPTYDVSVGESLID